MTSDATAATTPGREFEFTDEDFQQVRTLAHEHLGISLADSKRELVYGRLARRIRKLGLGSFADYLTRIESGDAAEFEEFCNAITTNLTAFFREDHHFDYLKREILPRLLEHNAATRRIRIWSAGCSTGEEPYSIAMTVCETAGNLAGWDLRILATDIDSNVLAHAAAGIYEAERFEKVDRARRDRWFSSTPDGRRFAARPELKRLIAFRRLNLIEAWPVRGPFDVIFCRNVIIYFDKSTQRDVIGRMAALQRAGDHLILGHSESLQHTTDRYKVEGRTIHRRIA
jgi:chemotaxis protein methyltransferase CheR